MTWPHLRLRFKLIDDLPSALIEWKQSDYNRHRRERNPTAIVTEELPAEISAVPVPANAGARTLSIKSAQPIELVSFEVA